MDPQEIARGRAGWMRSVGRKVVRGRGPAMLAGALVMGLSVATFGAISAMGRR